MMKPDKKKITAELGIDEEAYAELFRDFIAQTEKKIKKLGQTIAADNFGEMAKIAHEIKGSSGNLRITEMQGIAKSIEMAAKAGRNKQAITKNLQALKEAMEELRRLV